MMRLLDAHTYFKETLQGFLDDPPDSDFQRGYLVATINIGRDMLGNNSIDWGAYEAELLDKKPSSKKRSP